jgi:chromosome partitioning protein
MGKVITIANQKGGVGKTTTAVNLGLGLALNNKKALVIDIDAQGNACTGLGINKKEVDIGMYEILLEGVDIKDAINKTDYECLFIAPVDLDFASAHAELMKVDGREWKLKNAIEPVKNEYDYILIDCPPSLDIMTINGLVAADSVLIPLQCEYYAMEGMAKLINTIKLIQKGPNRNLHIEGVLLTMYDNRTNLSTQVMEEAVAYFKEKVYKTIIPRNVRLAEAPSYGKPISVYSPSSVGAKSYNNLAVEIIGHG